MNEVQRAVSHREKHDTLFEKTRILDRVRVNGRDWKVESTAFAGTLATGNT